MGAVGKEAWLAKAAEKHGYRFDYSKVDYVSARVKVKIICKIHGEYMQTPAAHTKGNGCRACSGKKRKTTEEWISEAKFVHGSKYDYSNSVYHNNCSKIKIKCRKHGEFEQLPKSHINGYGCPICPPRYNQPTSVYISEADGMVKIGISVNPKLRIARQLITQPFKSKMSKSWVLGNHHEARKVESLSHEILKDCKADLSGFDGYSEWFNVSSEEASKVIDASIKHFGFKVK